MKNVDNFYETDVFQKLINSYKKYNLVELQEWLDSIPNLLERYKELYSIDNLKIMENGRLGLLLYGFSSKFNEDVVIKIIPKFLDTYEIEFEAYRSLSSNYMCPLLDYDCENNILVIKKLNSGKSFVFKQDKKIVRSFFDKVYKNTYEYNDNGSNSYIEILKNNIKKISNVSLNIRNREFFESLVLSLYSFYFAKKPMCLLHGDLHSGNVLFDGNELYAIDPLGYVAPKEFIFVRFIMVELFYADEVFNYFEELLDFISVYINKLDLLLALLVDSYLFLTALVIQIDNNERLVPKVDLIINLIVSKLKELGVDFESEKDSYNFSEVRKFVLGGRKLHSVSS